MLFRDVFDARRVLQLASAIGHHCPAFDQKAFAAPIVADLPSLQLKGRVDAIAVALDRLLPLDFPQLVALLQKALGPPVGESVESPPPQTNGALPPHIEGWMIWPVSLFAVHRGRQEPALTLELLEEMTQRSSCEFAIRHVILRHPDPAFRALSAWTRHPSAHVRRLASEGSRPRLPWGIRLQPLVDNPAPLFPLLTALRDDPSEYVRRSVANNLNDIAKDHPDAVLRRIQPWFQHASPQRLRLLKHACRTLIKKGHPQALSLFGCHPIDLQSAQLQLHQNEIQVGDSLQFTFSATAKSPVRSKLIVDYRIHFKKANGSSSPKVFKGTKAPEIDGRKIAIHAAIPIRAVSTRRYYPGQHQLDIQINGQTAASAHFSIIS